VNPEITYRLNSTGDKGVDNKGNKGEKVVDVEKLKFWRYDPDNSSKRQVFNPKVWEKEMKKKEEKEKKGTDGNI
jgi:hypothetical protein